MNEREGNFITTYTGINFYPLDPRPDEIVIKDIAKALSHIARYNGHTEKHFSVGQHSILVCEELMARKYSLEIQLFGLLHDASEAYICDIPRPLKPFLTNYAEIEQKIQDMVYIKFVGRVPTLEEKIIIKQYDDEALMYEAKHFVIHNSWMWKEPELLTAHRDFAPIDIAYHFEMLFEFIINQIKGV